MAEEGCLWEFFRIFGGQPNMYTLEVLVNIGTKDGLEKWNSFQKIIVWGSRVQFSGVYVE